MEIYSMGRCALHLFLWELELRYMGCIDWNSAIRTYGRTSFRRSRGQEINGCVMDLVLTTVIYLTFIYYISLCIPCIIYINIYPSTWYIYYSVTNLTVQLFLYTIVIRLGIFTHLWEI